MGVMIQSHICGQCASSEVRYCCAYHRIYLCEHCRHLDCTYQIGAGWELVWDGSSERSEVSSSTLDPTQAGTVALFQILAPENPRAAAFAQRMNVWPMGCLEVVAVAGSSSVAVGVVAVVVVAVVAAATVATAVVAAAAPVVVQQHQLWR